MGKKDLKDPKGYLNQRNNNCWTLTPCESRDTPSGHIFYITKRRSTRFVGVVISMHAVNFQSYLCFYVIFKQEPNNAKRKPEAIL